MTERKVGYKDGARLESGYKGDKGGQGSDGLIVKCECVANACTKI